MRFVEAVRGEFFNLVENMHRRILVDAVLFAPLVGIFPADWPSLLYLFCPSRAARHRLRQANIPQEAGDLHHLLLVDHDPVGLGQNFWHFRMVDLDRFSAMFAVDERGDHLHRAGTIESADGDDLFERVDMQLPRQVLHAPGLELEDAECFSLVKNVKCRLVLQGQVDPVDGLAVLLFNGVDALSGWRSRFSIPESRS